MSVSARTALAAAVLVALTLVALPAASFTAAGGPAPVGGPAPAVDVGPASQNDGNGTGATTADDGNGSETTTAGSDTGTAGADDAESDAENGTGAVEAYDGAHVSVGVGATAVTNYSVDGRTYFDSIGVQSGAGGTDADGVDPSPTGPAGASRADLAVTARSPAALALRSETGAALSVHDNEHGIVVVRATRGTQYVRMNVSENAEANYEGDSQVIVTTEERDDASVTVVGNASLGLDDEGNAVAELGPEGLLVVRAYEGKRGSDDRKQEAFIGDGVATGEVYVMDRPNGTVVDTIAYENETNLTASAGEETVNLTVERSQQQGAVVFTSLDATLADPNSAVRVTVDGEPAPVARTYAQLRTAANNGPEPRYKVSQSTQGGAAADVMVAINRFSAGETHEVAIRSVEAVDGNGTPATATATTAPGTTAANTTAGTAAPPANATGTTTPPADTPTSATSPGFGAVATLAGLVALLAAAVAATRRR